MEFPRRKPTVMPDPSPSPGRPSASRHQPAVSNRPRQTGSKRSDTPGIARAERHGTRWRDIEWVDFADNTEAEDPIDPPPSLEANPSPAMTSAGNDDGFRKLLRQFGQTAPANSRPQIPGLAARFGRLPVPRQIAPRTAMGRPPAPDDVAAQGATRAGDKDHFPASVLTPVGTKPEPPPLRPSVTETLGTQLSQASAALRRQRDSVGLAVSARLARARTALRPRRAASASGTALRRQRETIGTAVRARLGRARDALRPRQPAPSPSPEPRAEPTIARESPADAPPPRAQPAAETIAPNPQPRPAKPSPASVLAGHVYRTALRFAGNDPEILRRWVRVAGTAIAIAVAAYAVGAMVAALTSSDTRRHTMSDQPARSTQTAVVQPKPQPPSAPPPAPVAATPPSEPAARAAFYLARAKAGDPVAQYDVGVLYAQGNGLVQDYASAASWFHAAATQGNVDAEYNLGVLYERGLGVTANPMDAVNWYRSAADQNHAGAQYNLAIAYAEGHGTEQDLATAARWYQRAAQQGLAGAMVNLAILYERGQGVTRSPVDAYAWYSAAAEHGDGPAKDRADELFRQLTDQDRAKAQALAATVAAAINGAPPA